jgi:alkanesulfonate monooxygenase SsuD/methylene tetrahydromethanopterin reductase-like flavin-dependent oxidoreductase (luciferase family)
VSSSNRVPLGLNLSFWERTTTVPELLEIARLADDLGFANLTVSESFGRDGFVIADRLLAATTNIDVCFGLANPFSRSPAVLAAGAATLNDLSGGRFVLGLGSSTPNLVAGWHGLAFERPLRRTRETIDMCHRIWQRDASPYDGDIFRAGGVKLAFEPQFGHIPIWSGALLESSLGLTGEIFDGWMPGLMPFEHVQWGLEHIDRGLALSDRGRESIIVAPTTSVCADEAKALAGERFAIAMYYGSAGSPYATAASKVGFADDVAAIQKAYTSGGARGAASAVSDRMVRSVAIVGSHDQCRDEIGMRLSSGVDRISIGLPATTRQGCEPILRGLIPSR